MPDQATSLERIPTVIVGDHDELGRLVACRIAELIRARGRAGRRTVLGFATGSTPIGVYRELIRMHREEGLSFAQVVTFNLDEYYPMDRGSVHSYHRFMWENLFSLLDIAPDNVHIPRGDLRREQVEEECRRYEEAIRAAGGIDLQLLGIGRTGHVGFNEPGSGLESRTRLITLDLVTRKDAAADFFGEDNVPREAVTMGVGTILEAREIVILATGEHKAHIVRRAVEGEVDHEVAATFLQRHAGTTFYLDGAAGARLTRIATPWLLGPVEWTPQRTVSAVTWLSHETEKAILKLTQRDYAEHRLSSLVAAHGTPGALNGLVFNALGAKIRGRSKLPRRQSVICFSPHPDDDVISMGGILRKLVENENAITVAYMTSGNLAVFDHDVRRHLDFLSRVAGERGMSEGTVSRLVSRVEKFLAAQAPRRRGHRGGARHQAHDPRVGGGGGPSDPGSGRGRGPLPRSPVLPDRQGAQGSHRPGGRRHGPRAPRQRPARPRLRGGRPLRPPRHPPDVQGGDRPRAGGDRGRGACPGPRCGSTAAPGRSGR